MPDADIIDNNEREHRFELHAPEGYAHLKYHYRGRDTIVLVHTEVPPELQGRGIAGHLARTALEFARAHNLMVVPTCPFVRAFLQRHPEFNDLVVA